jgi:hypothetical protein
MFQIPSAPTAMTSAAATGHDAMRLTRCQIGLAMGLVTTTSGSECIAAEIRPPRSTGGSN